MPARLIEFPPKGKKAAPPSTYLVTMSVVAKTAVQAYTPEAAAQLARQRLDRGDAAFSDPHIIDILEAPNS